MRILLLERDYSRCGGSEAMALEVVKGLLARGHVIYLVHEIGGRLLDQNRAVFQASARVGLQPFGWRRLGAALKTVWALWRLVRKWQIDVIFSSHLGYIRSLALLRALFGVPFAYHLGLGPPTQSRSIRWSIRHLDAGISPSHFNGRKWMKAGLPESKLYLVPNWVDARRFSPGDGKLVCRQKLGFPEGGMLVVYVGRVVQEKGVESLIEAFGRIAQKQTNVTLLVVGDATDKYKQKINSLIAEWNLHKSQVRYVDNSTTPEHYFAAADVAIVPSIAEESFGLTAVEAMACGNLTLVSDAGELPNLLGEENWDLVFPAGNAVALTTKLEHWLAQPEAARQRGMKLRARVLDKFQASDKLDRYETILAGLTKR
jgi:glycosyltransferase involved in cell wall biosynthesis